ncbi:XTP/dITP diphosphatase [Acidaminobacter hydrogenoformans]|uniref:dITP/XTP pyrophosphatase n=1 Tax=Acidaminobacter hydrogenoformans DSM 2784 TaxID=1120920 RepID=A0A1G5RXG0_9FIRM|nr:XTP/dITP diphosphatase [Acidaminobacter hydrogenoformans]SCZ78825.1 XTP/dITP diphosphohydrolase [Acidaminobacter hydrogenoformans DSM 2784]
MSKVVLASSNSHKLKELQAMLSEFDFELLSLSDVGLAGLDIPEEGDTFEANSLYKAQVVSEMTGHPAIADDSGLMVAYLNGAPGVYSARYAGEPKSDKANNAKLVDALKGVPEGDRGAKFVTVITFYINKDTVLTARGEVEGRILEEERGTGGFGYDPLFYVASLDKTFAELSSEEKNAISHRGRAIKELQTMLSQ